MASAVGIVQPHSKLLMISLLPMLQLTVLIDSIVSRGTACLAFDDHGCACEFIKRSFVALERVDESRQVRGHQQLSPCVCAASRSCKIRGAFDVLILGMPSLDQSCPRQVHEAEWSFSLLRAGDVECDLPRLRP